MGARGPRNVLYKENMSPRTGTKSRKSALADGAGAGSRRVGVDKGVAGEPLRAEALGTLEELRAALAELLGAVGVPIRQPRDLKVALGLHQTLAWKIHRITQGDDPLADAQFIPGASGFATFLEAARAHGGLWVPVVHPFATGRLARWHAWHRHLETAVARGDVWFAPMEDIAAHVQHLVATGGWTPRIDRLPYYAAPVRVA